MTVPYYIDPSITPAQESDSFDGGFGVGKLRDSWKDISWTPDSRCYGAAGTTFTTVNGSMGRILISVDGVKGAPIYVGRYGVGPRPKIIDNSDCFLNLQGRRCITVEDLNVVGTPVSPAAYGTLCYGSTTQSAIGLTIRRCLFESQKFAAMWGYCTAINQLGAEDILWEDNEIPAGGILFGGELLNMVVRRNLIHALTGPAYVACECHPHKAMLTAGWTNIGGTIWSHPIGAQSWKSIVPDIYLCNYDGKWTLNRSAKAPTAIGLYDFTFVSGVLYINVPADPNGKNVHFNYSVMTASFEYNEIHDAHDSNGVEGRAIQLDDGTSNVRVIGNLLVNCDNGVDCNMGTGNLIQDNVVVNCLKDGIEAGIQGARGNEVLGNTVIGNQNAGTGINLGTVGSAANSAFNNTIHGYATGIRGLAASVEDDNRILGASMPQAGGITPGLRTQTKWTGLQ